MINYGPNNHISPKDWDGNGIPNISDYVEFVKRDDYKDSQSTRDWHTGDLLRVLSRESVDSSLVLVVWNERRQSASSVAMGCIRLAGTEDYDSEPFDDGYDYDRYY